MLLMVLSLLKSLPMKINSEFDDTSFFAPLVSAPRYHIARKRFHPAPMGGDKKSKEIYRLYLHLSEWYAPPVCVVVGAANDNTDQSEG